MNGMPLIIFISTDSVTLTCFSNRLSGNLSHELIVTFSSVFFQVQDVGLGNRAVGDQISFYIIHIVVCNRVTYDIL